ncbi:hypothetical protein TanjilG_19875 [Lupinus angustifolius]|uniref:DNA damage-binding protein 1 n=1 Tax=Lupinus angustifolius TaxID=3871 RepID=A0A1J7IRW4_LUPAN|nr:hypothetical protein TanjilG_19875 [Lupinus angustifolius]
MCPFNSAAFPDSLAIAKEGVLTIGTIDDIQKLHIRSIPLGEQARLICHQEQSRTFAICSLKYNPASAEESEMHFARLLDDQTFEFISTYPLDTYEFGCYIISCCFAEDNNVYYCVGTAYVLPEENEPTKGRTLVFSVEDGKLQLIAEKETEGAVYCLNAFNGKLLAAINQKIQLYKRFIVVGDLMKSISLLIYKHGEGAIEERARDYNANWMSAAEILDDDIYLDRKKISLGTQPITLWTFSSKNTTHVFAASDRPTEIYSNNKKLLYSNVNLKEVSHMCPFNSAAFPDSLAIAKEGVLTIGTIDDIQKLHIRSIPLGEQARLICHQEQSRTFAICSLKYNPASAEESEMHFARLLDDQTFEFISTYPLDTYEFGCYIISCCFAEDNNVYYCVGTAYVLPEENEPTKGRTLVFSVEDGKLQLIAEKETEGAVYCLNAFNGKLLAAINQKIQLYKRFIVVGDLMKSISLLIYKHGEGAIEERARDYNANWMSAAEILDDDIYLGAENNFNLFAVWKNSEGATDEERGRLEVVDEYHLGEFVNRFRHGSLVMCLPNSDAGQIPTVIFGTINGVIGVIASLPNEQYFFLDKLQSNLKKVIKGVGGLNHEQWRSFNKEKKTVDARNFLDGDLIKSFVDLNRSKMDDISKAMDVSVEELCERVEELTRLH